MENGLVSRVLVYDDDLPRSTFEAWFADDLHQRQQRQGHAALRRFKVDGQVCRTVIELKYALEDARDAGAPPDLVLIDNLLQRAPGGAAEHSAVSAIRLIVSTFGDARPRCVLHTSGPTMNDSWAFCSLGGHNVVDKFHPLDRPQILWDTIDGRCWKPPPLRTAVKITDANGRLLPYMELLYWKHNALEDLPGLTDAAATKAKGRLVSAFELSKGAEPAEIVAAANAEGLAWVPLASRHMLPEDHPEHRAHAFRHRLPGLSQF